MAWAIWKQIAGELPPWRLAPRHRVRMKPLPPKPTREMVAALRAASPPLLKNLPPVPTREIVVAMRTEMAPPRVSPQSPAPLPGAAAPAGAETGGASPLQVHPEASKRGPPPSLLLLGRVGVAVARSANTPPRSKLVARGGQALADSAKGAAGPGTEPSQHSGRSGHPAERNRALRFAQGTPPRRPAPPGLTTVPTTTLAPPTRRTPVLLADELAPGPSVASALSATGAAVRTPPPPIQLTGAPLVVRRSTQRAATPACGQRMLPRRLT